jgi:hypothetical protein
MIALFLAILATLSGATLSNSGHVVQTAAHVSKPSPSPMSGHPLAG